jgi:glutathione S-transferase
LATDGSPGKPPVLWQYTFSNFNEKVRWTLDHKRIPHVRHSVLPGSPRALWWSRGDGTLPMLDLDGRRIVDSTKIIEALESRDPEPAIYPSDPDERTRALELEDFFDENAGHDLRRVIFWELLDDPGAATEVLATGQPGWTRYFLRAQAPVAALYARRRYSIRADEVERSKGKLAAALDRIEAELQPSGYLVGDSFTVADLTAAALLYPLANPPEFPYPIPDPPPKLQSLVVSFSSHPAVQWIAEMYRRHRGTSAEIGAEASPASVSG